MLVTAGGEPRVRTFSGRALAVQEAELAFQVPGLLVSLPVREGQRVVQGEVIAQLRREEFEARLSSLQGQLDQGQVALRALRAGARPEEQARLESQVRAAEARLANARADYERFSELVRTEAVSRQEFDRAAAVYQVTQEELESARRLLEQGTVGREEDIEAREADVRSLEGRVREAQIQFEDSILRAPFDGVVAQRYVEENQNINARQPIVLFQNTDEIDVVVDVPESIMAAGLTRDDIVELVAEFSAARGTRFPLRVREISKSADPVTQTFRIRSSMKAAPGYNILPGMTATATLTYRQGGEKQDRLMVPLSAIYQEGGGTQVAWVIEGDQTVKRRPVQIGEAAGGMVEILDGLTPGNRVAVAGVSFLQEGMRVRDLGNALGGNTP